MATQGPTILLVDPDQRGVERLTGLLEKDGAETVACGSGAKALDLMNGKAVHVVVTELSLPDMTGLDLIRALEEGWPGLPVIVIAQDASVSDAVGALRSGAADFLEKPFNPEQIAYVINKA